MKRFYKENRVFVILISIALICIIAIAGMALNYVIKSSTKDNYGNRLIGIDDVELTDELIQTLKDGVSKNDSVKTVNIKVHGKIINFIVDFTKNTTVRNAQGVAVKALEGFDEDYRNFYDIQFLFEKSESDNSDGTFPMIGYIKAEGTTIKWSNNAE